jgi:cytoskeleton protein RodZ
LPSFGEKLKQEREKRKITLEQISSSTKIGTRMLQALEEDKFNQLPGGIFNKGFVRAYARTVGLDEDQIVADYLQASGDALPARTDIAVLDDETPENERRESNEENIGRLNSDGDSGRSLPWGLFAVVLLVVALALFLWSRHQRQRARQQVAPATALASSSSGGEVAMSLPVTKTPTAAAPRVAPSVAMKLPPPSPAKSTATTANSVATAAAPGEFTVIIRAREESWISVTADGKGAGSEILAGGSERSIHGRKKVTVKVGNAGGVELSFNGKKLDTGGEYGEVKTVTLGPRGVIPAPATSP